MDCAIADLGTDGRGGRMTISLTSYFGSGCDPDPSLDGIDVCSDLPAVSGEAHVTFSPKITVEVGSPATLRNDPVARLVSELEGVSDRIASCLQLVDSCEQTEAAVRALRATYDRTLHLWSQEDARLRPPRPAEPAELCAAQARYMAIRDDARDARHELIGLRARDTALRARLQALAAEETASDAALALSAFRLLLDEIRPAVTRAGAECRRLREAFPQLVPELLRLTDELKQTLW
jgi:hypothetical protein